MSQLTRRDAIGIVSAVSLGLVAETNAVADEKPAVLSTKDQTMGEPDQKTLQELAKRAKSISEKAYCPYSKFRVGAAVLTADGQIFDGCNVENASYGLTICAERNAVFQMAARGQLKITAIAIYTPTPTPSAPCGACRQVVNEFGPDALVISSCDGPDILKKKLSELLPDAFGPANLRKG